eukprot:gb/GEZN01016876.1/.p1 GENE.gb/GEZN01016876.1/~~gb/GEZN01016876.1/.p1  ORF type:complete len:253 (-),score=34.70 gb/GEZN01016876.1/:20-778(-)
MASEKVKRVPLVGGNWKSTGTLASVKALMEGLCAGKIPEGVEVVIAPTLLHLLLVQKQTKPPYQLSAQNCSATGDGAFTGEVSAAQLADAGIEWIILGHSERRRDHNDSKVLAQKIQMAQKAKRKLIICLGEQLADRKSGKYVQVVQQQMTVIAEAVKDWSGVVLAYEPVWAIGTGVSATPQQASEVHGALRDFLAKTVSPEVADATRIIYGGSVNPKNAKELRTQPNIDGFLVGGASLIAPDFISIIQSAL